MPCCIPITLARYALMHCRPLECETAMSELTAMAAAVAKTTAQAMAVGRSPVLPTYSLL